jgi:DNA-binding MarR family transcriptional regulator
MSTCYCISLRTAARKTSAIYDEALEPFGINIAQYSLMRRIEAAGQISLTELARLTELDRSTVGRNAKVLERMELLRHVTGRDHREATIELTEQGRKTIAVSRPAWEIAQNKIETLLGGPEGTGRLNDILQSL